MGNITFTSKNEKEEEMKKKTISFDEAAKIMQEPEVFKEEAKDMARSLDLFALKYGDIGLQAVLAILKVK